MSYKQYKEVIFGIIPARKGSKGILNKNIKSLLGRPLIAYTIETALDSKTLNRLIISTDSLKIGKIAQKYGAELPFLRPKELARDNTPMISVLRHAIRFLEQKENFFPDVIILLQPTSPLRKPIHIIKALEEFFKSKADSVVSLCEAEYSPYWMKRLLGNRVVSFIEDRREHTCRQDLPKVYRLNGAIYITKRDIIMKENRILGKDTRAIVMDRDSSIDIDTTLDFKIAELILKDELAKEGLL